MAVDSKAVFQNRLATLGLGPMFATFEANGWQTLGDFAFATSWTPSAATDDLFVRDVLTPLVGAGDSPFKAQIRRLWFEAFTMATSDLKRKIERPEDEDKPRKLPVAERAHRLNKIRDDLRGVRIEGELEPSDASLKLI